VVVTLRPLVVVVPRPLVVVRTPLLHDLHTSVTVEAASMPVCVLNLSWLVDVK
jgi:hypothetical protein